MAFRIGAMRCDKMRACHAQLLRFLVHHIGKAFQRTAHMNSNGRSGIVARYQHHAIYKLTQGKLLSVL